MAILFLVAALLGCASCEPLGAFSVLDPGDGGFWLHHGLQPRVGRAVKHEANPLFGQSELWEPRIDNGYANVIHDPSDPNGAWRLWYDVFTRCNDDERDDKGRYVNCGGGRREHSMLYARSDDGINWTKPAMDFVCYSASGGVVECGQPGALKTNILVPSANGGSVWRDAHEQNASRAFKIAGQFMGPPSPGHNMKGGGICMGPDGLHFPECVNFDIENVHWDTWTNLFYDNRTTHQYVEMMRASNHSNPCGTDFYPGCVGRCPLEHCFDTKRTISRVHTVGDDITTMGASGGNIPVEWPTTPNDQLYVQVAFPYLNAYLGVVMVYEAATARQGVRCRLAWSNDTVHWNRLDEDLIPRGADGTFESHICYGSIPSTMQNGTIAMYYFGGDGPHYGVRNSSLALATFRPHGLIGVGAPAEWITRVQSRTIPLLVTGRTMKLSADTDIPMSEHPGSGYVVPAGRVTLSIGGASGDLRCSVTKANVTEAAVDDCDLSSLVGQTAVFDIEIEGGALLYTIDFV